MFPNTPAMINWHNQKCQLSQIKMQWIVDAAMQVNPKLKQNPKSSDIVLYSITRLDISNNSLVSIPLQVFQLQSLKVLNISQNRIDKLPMPVASPTKRGFRRKSTNSEELLYNCPVLEELYLHDNRLDQIPDAIFKLPSLVTLVVSYNKLQQLPYSMWLAPKLKELNASFNLLKELPYNQPQEVILFIICWAKLCFTEKCFFFQTAKEEINDRLSISSSDSQLSVHSELVLDQTENSDYEISADGVKLITYKKKDRSLV